MDSQRGGVTRRAVLRSAAWTAASAGALLAPSLSAAAEVPVRVTTPAPLPPLLADFDFASTSPLTSVVDPTLLPALRQGAGSAVTFVSDPAFGRVARFNGRSDYLVVPAADLGRLDFGRSGDTVTLLAWVRRVGAGDGFVAGIWTEDALTLGRSAGIFVNLPGYGGEDTVCAHVSATGGPSIGLPYSRDFAASGRRITPNQWRAVALSLDTGSVTAYLDGLADPRPVYKEPGPPKGQGLTYSKNPYLWTAGLNHGGRGDFTVGATRLTSGMAHFLNGDIARVSVYPTALTQAQVSQWIAQTKPPTVPWFGFDGWRRAATSYATFGGSTSAVWSPALYGWRSVAGTAAVDASARSDTWSWAASRCQLILPTATAPRFTYYDAIGGVTLGQLTRARFLLTTVSAAESMRVCLRIGGQWWARDPVFARTASGTAQSDGTHTQWRDLIVADLAKVPWRPLTVSRNTALTLGTARSLSFGNAELQGVGFYAGALANPLMIGNLAVS